MRPGTVAEPKDPSSMPPFGKLRVGRPDWGRILQRDVARETMVWAHIQNDPIEKHVAPPPRMTICPFRGDTIEDPTSSGLGTPCSCSPSGIGLAPTTRILEPVTEHNSTSCFRGTTPSRPTPPRTTKESSCWMQVALKRANNAEEAPSISAGVKVMEGAYSCQNVAYSFSCGICTYLTIAQD